MFFPFGAGCLVQLCSVGWSCAAQACCWYNVFKCCGCIDKKHQKLPEEKYAHPPPPPPPPPPQPIPVAKPINPKDINPFLINTGVPKDTHLQQVYMSHP